MYQNHLEQLHCLFLFYFGPHDQRMIPIEITHIESQLDIPGHTVTTRLDKLQIIFVFFQIQSDKIIGILFHVPDMILNAFKDVVIDRPLIHKTADIRIVKAYTV